MTKRLILFIPEADKLLKERAANNVTELVNLAVIAQLGQGKAASRAKLKILLALTEKENEE